MTPHLILTINENYLEFHGVRADGTTAMRGSDPTPNGGVRAERVEHLINYFRSFHPDCSVEILTAS